MKRKSWLNGRIEGVDGMEAAARAISRKGPKHVVLKGGHLGGEPVDLLFDGTQTTTYKRRRVERVVHGTGCIFSSGLCAFMACGYPVKEAFLETERLIDGLLPESYQPGDGAYYYAFPSHALAGMRKNGVFCTQCRKLRRAWKSRTWWR